MKVSFTLLGFSSLIMLVSACGGIGALQALDAQYEMVHYQEQPLELPAEPGFPSQSVVLYGSLAMLFWCVIGAMIGAWTYVFIIPDPNATQRRMAAKLVSATGCGITLTPLVIHFGGFPKDPNLIGGISTIVAIGAVAIIVDIFPLVTAKLKNWLVGKFPGDGDR